MPDRHDVLDADGNLSAVAEVSDDGWITFLVVGASPQQFRSVDEFLTTLHAVGGSCPTLEAA